MLNRKSTQVHPRNSPEEVDPIQVGVTAGNLLGFAYFKSNSGFFLLLFFLYLSQNATKLLLFKVLTKIEGQGCVGVPGAPGPALNMAHVNWVFKQFSSLDETSACLSG